MGAYIYEETLTAGPWEEEGWRKAVRWELCGKTMGWEGDEKLASRKAKRKNEGALAQSRRHLPHMYPPPPIVPAVNFTADRPLQPPISGSGPGSTLSHHLSSAPP